MSSVSATGQPPAPEPAAQSTLAFVVTEDWFFVSHFLPMARTARGMGLNVVVITRCGKHRALIEQAGATVECVDWSRGSLNPLRLLADARRVAGILRRARADAVHAIALRGILVGGLAARRAGIDRRIFAVTGLGYLGARRDMAGSVLRKGIGRALRFLGGDKTVYLFENRDDPVTLGLEPQGSGANTRIAFVGGAGVDPALLPERPMPDTDGPLRIAIVARMLWSKGIDVAVEAIGLARAAGADVTLDIYGTPDAENPRSIDEATLAAWSKRDGVRWHGRSENVAAVWATHHLACVPSRGGEGLPRTLLEAAACGRAILASDVAGCRTFVRHGREGLLVEAGNATALAEAVQTLARDPAAIRAMGAAARQRIFEGFSEADVREAMRLLYQELLVNP